MRKASKKALDAVYYSPENCCTYSKDGQWADCDNQIDWRFDESGAVVGTCDDHHEVIISKFLKNLPLYLASDGKAAPEPKVFDRWWKDNESL